MTTDVPKKDKRLWIALGVGAAVLAAGALAMCCVVTVLVYGLRGGAEKKLVGKWDGAVKAFGQNLTMSVEFKSNGRFSAVDGLGETWTGTWKVKLVEENAYHLNLVYDSVPDRVQGWTATFKDDDTITLDGFTAITPTLKRNR